MAKAKINIKPKSNLHFQLGDAKTGKKVLFQAGITVEVDPDDIANLDKKDYEVVTGKEPDGKKA